MEASALAFGVSCSTSELETALQNARQAKTDQDLAAALDRAESALAKLKKLAESAFAQIKEENA